MLSAIANDRIANGCESVIYRIVINYQNQEHIHPRRHEKRVLFGRAQYPIVSKRSCSDEQRAGPPLKGPTEVTGASDTACFCELHDIPDPEPPEGALRLMSNAG